MRVLLLSGGYRGGNKKQPWEAVFFGGKICFFRKIKHKAVAIYLSNLANFSAIYYFE
jgi:hypothetical protein